MNVHTHTHTHTHSLYSWCVVSKVCVQACPFTRPKLYTHRLAVYKSLSLPFRLSLSSSNTHTHTHTHTRTHYSPLNPPTQAKP